MTRTRHSSCTIRDHASDQLSAAAAAVASGSTNEAYWDTLGAFAERDGIDHVAGILQRCSRIDGPTRAWWRCTLLISMDVSAEQVLKAARELAAIEEAGGGPRFNAERQALQLTRVIDYLQGYLCELRAGTTSSVAHSAAEMVVRAARVAEARVGRRASKVVP